MSIGVLVLIFIALGAVLLVGIVVLFMNTIRQPPPVYADQRFVVRGANCFGQQSRGMMQIRGNGHWVLTGSAIYFDMWLPQRHFEIPLATITSLETPRSFLGKTRFSPLLQVNFTNADGQPDAIAWHMPDVEAARAAIEAARQG